MHMADALISPAVGGTLWAAAAALTVHSARKLKEDVDERKVPLMGVLGAFIFAAQMINFTIPGTGSSGHLGGGMILAILLGPHAAFLTMTSILTVQALFFADGGLLALGCNIFNLGFFPCFVAYPLIYRSIAGGHSTQGRVLSGSMLAAVVSLQMGAFAVVLETTLSGVSELPFSTFALLMQPIHLAIGIVEGAVTAAVVGFILKARPEILDVAEASGISARFSLKGVLGGLLVLSILTGGVLSWFASSNPDGLEWSMFKTSGKEEVAAPEGGIHSALAKVQEDTAILPDYDFRKPEEHAGKTEGTWLAANPGTSVSGLVGGAMTLLLAGLVGFGLRRLGS